jgi:hypothetical protein
MLRRTGGKGGQPGGYPVMVKNGEEFPALCDRRAEIGMRGAAESRREGWTANSGSGGVMIPRLEAYGKSSDTAHREHCRDSGGG